MSSTLIRPARTPESRGARSSGPLQVAEDAFVALTTGPAPLSLDGALIGGRAGWGVSLARVRGVLTSAGKDRGVRDAVWARLVGAARESGGAATVGAVGCALPGLRRVAGMYTRGLELAAREEVDAEILAGFLAAVGTVDLESPRIYSRLLTAARVAGRRAVAAETGVRRAVAAVSDQPPVPAGHPDVVLDGLVEAGVITAGEADLVATTRLEDTSLAEAAFVLGISYTAAKLRRRRAEERIALALTGEIPDRRGRIAPRRHSRTVDVGPGALTPPGRHANRRRSGRGDGGRSWQSPAARRSGVLGVSR